jgi:hypothetical protein
MDDHQRLFPESARPDNGINTRRHHHRLRGPGLGEDDARIHKEAPKRAVHGAGLAG